MQNHDDANDIPQQGYAGSAGTPSTFDRLMGVLHGLPDVTKTQPSTIRVVPPLGIGGTELWIVQTYRQREQGDMVFLEYAAEGRITRLVLPVQVCNTIARQRDQLTSKVRSKTAKRIAQERKDAGILPGFMKHRKKK